MFKLSFFPKILTLLLVFFLYFQSSFAQVEFINESLITNEGLYFWYANPAKKAYHWARQISPRGDCYTLANGYIFFGWYKGGMNNRQLMISRKKIGSGNWVHVSLPATNTLTAHPQGPFGDSHRTISVGVSTKDNTVHLMFDHHNEPLRYIVSDKNVAFASDTQFTADKFQAERTFLAEGQNLTITYPAINEHADGDLVVNYRKGSAIGGNEIIHVYDGEQWTRSKMVSRGVGDGIPESEKNYAYGSTIFANGSFYRTFTVRWKRNKEIGRLNEGVYVAKCGSTMDDPWEGVNGTTHTLPVRDFSPFFVDDPISTNQRGSSQATRIAVSERGDIYLAYTPKDYKYTYTRYAGETTFTKHEGVDVLGKFYNGRMYRSSITNGVIKILSCAAGELSWREDYVHDTGRNFGAMQSRIEGGNMVVIAQDGATNSDKLPIYCYTFRLGVEAETADKLTACNISASTAQAPNLAANAIDGNINTRWSANGDGQLLTLDLCDTYEITDVKIAFYRGNERHTNFDIQVSDDNANWTNVLTGASSSGNTLSLEDFDINDTEGRYIRYVGRGNESNTWNSVTEIEVYGNEVQQQMPTITIESVDAEDGANVSENMLDGDENDDSRWSAKFFSKSVVFDLGSRFNITGTRMWTYQNRAYKYRVQISDNPSSGFTTVVDQTNNNNAAQPHVGGFNGQARYVKLTITGAHGYSGDWASITEFEIETNGSARKVESAIHVSPSDLKIYPNPSAGVFTLSKASYWSVTSLDHSYTLHGKGTTVDLSGETKGVYILTVEEKAHRLMLK